MNNDRWFTSFDELTNVDRRRKIFRPAFLKLLDVLNPMVSLVFRDSSPFFRIMDLKLETQNLCLFWSLSYKRCRGQNYTHLKLEVETLFDATNFTSFRHRSWTKSHRKFLGLLSLSFLSFPFHFFSHFIPSFPTFPSTFSFFFPKKITKLPFNWLGYYIFTHLRHLVPKC